MNQTLCTFLLACAALSLAAAPDPVRQAREQLALVKPDAARRALADLKGNPKYDYAKNAAAVEALLAKIDQVRNDLEKGDDAAKAAAVQLVECYRKAMLANPILDARRCSRTRSWTSTRYSACTARSTDRAARSADAAAA